MQVSPLTEVELFNSSELIITEGSIEQGQEHFLDDVATRLCLLKVRDTTFA